MAKNIWFKENPELKLINKACDDTMVTHLGIKIEEVGADFLMGTMPIDARTVQPQRRLHGGANCVLAETLGSIAANMVLDQSKYVAFGQSINANHLRPAARGIVKGVTSPIHLGRSTQVWEIIIFDEQERLTCISRLTMAVVKK